MSVGAIRNIKRKIRMVHYVNSDGSTMLMMARVILSLFLLNAPNLNLVAAVKSPSTSLTASNCCFRKKDCMNVGKHPLSTFVDLKIRGGQQNDRYYDYNDDDDYRYDKSSRRSSRSSSSDRYYDNRDDGYQQEYNENDHPNDQYNDYYGRDGYEYNEGDYGSDRGRPSVREVMNTL